MSTSEQASYRDLSRLSSALKIGLALFTIVSALCAWSSWLQIDLLTQAELGFEFSEEEGNANDAREGVVAGLYTLVYLVTAILFLRWTLLTKRNADALGALDLKFRPGWSVGYYFIPIVTLWKPYQALRETFQASHPDHDERNWELAPFPSWLPIWWTFWLIAGATGQAQFRMSLRAETLDALLNASWMGLWSSLVDVPLGVLAWLVVTRLSPSASGEARESGVAPSDRARSSTGERRSLVHCRKVAKALFSVACERRDFRCASRSVGRIPRRARRRKTRPRRLERILGTDHQQSFGAHELFRALPTRNAGDSPRGSR